jgi:predicted O-methyltransferase YrrM
VLKGMSGDVLRTLPPVETYDFIYVDGSHVAADVLTDAVLAWPLLKKRGLMAFDDYLWTLAGAKHERPGIGIDAFRSAFAGRLAVLFEGSQLAVAKL